MDFDGRPWPDHAATLLAVNVKTAGRRSDAARWGALSASLLLARRAEAIGSPPLRNIAVDLYIRLQPVLALHSIWAPLHPELPDWADVRFRSWISIDPANRLEGMIFWRGQRRRQWPHDAAASSVGVGRRDRPGDLCRFLAATSRWRQVSGQLEKLRSMQTPSCITSPARPSGSSSPRRAHSSARSQQPTGQRHREDPAQQADGNAKSAFECHR